MPESFLAALRVVLPMALLIMLGVGVRKAGIMDRTVMRNVDKLTFRVFMPVLLFKNIYETDLSQSFTPEEAVFAALSLVLVIFPTALLLPPRLVKSRAQAASIGQAMIRSNYILFGIAVAESIFGEGNVGPVALLGAIVVPLTNALSVIVLEMGRSGRAEPKRLALSILKNPMVVAALAAIAASALPFRMPELLWGVVKDVAGVTTTISFISLGVPLSVALGFRNQSLCGLMVLFAAPTAVASYPMAVAMGADGPLAGQLVCAGTILSIFTMFFYTFLFRSLGML